MTAFSGANHNSEIIDRLGNPTLMKENVNQTCAVMLVKNVGHFKLQVDREISLGQALYVFWVGGSAMERAQAVIMVT